MTEENQITLEVGEQVEGKVISIEDKQVIIDTQYKFDAILPISEMSHRHIEHPNEMVSEGDEIVVQVKKIEDDALIVSKKLVDEKEAWDRLVSQYENNEHIETTVQDVVKGGVTVDLGVRGFIPASQVSNHFVEDFEPFKGTEITVKITEIEPENNKLILSRRLVLDEEKSEKESAALKEIKVGQVVEGTVQRLAGFGAFVDIGGIDGLVHISQVAHEHIDSISDVLEVGQKLDVKVLSIDTESGRISLSHKDTLPGPWDSIEDKFTVGDVVKGTVKRLTHFGAFVEVDKGVEGLVHISQISKDHIGTPSEVLEANQEVEVKVLEVNVSGKRLSLSIKEVENDKEQEEYKRYSKEEEHGFSLGDVLGDQANKLK